MNLSDDNTFGNGLLYVGFNQDQGNGSDLVVDHLLALDVGTNRLHLCFAIFRLFCLRNGEWISGVQ